MDIPVSYVLEDLKANFGVECKDSPFLVHVNLSNMEGIHSHYSIADLRFNINALKNEKQDAQPQVKELKNNVRKNKKVKWNEEWEKEAIDVVFEKYKKKFKKRARGIDRGEPVNGSNRFTEIMKEAECSKELQEHCNALHDMGFRHLRNVRRDGNSYYRAVIYGYFETLLSGEEGLIFDFIKMLKEDDKYFNCGKNQKSLKDEAITIVERIAKVKKEFGTQRALNEYFLESIASDDLNYVYSKLSSRY